MVNETWNKMSSDKVKHIYDWLTEKERQEMLNLLKEKEKANTTDLWESGVEDSEIPQELKDYRKAWKEKMYNSSSMDHVSDVIKERIVTAAEKIKVKINRESDGSRLIEFKLRWKEWKILDPKLKTHSENEYKSNHNYDSITHVDDLVKLWWMWWDNVEQWKNKKLAEYVKEKQWEWLHVAKVEEIKQILSELWEKSYLYYQEDQIAMLMYLTWMDWQYRLSMWDNEKSNSQANARSFLHCNANIRDFYYFNNRAYDCDASLCMIACD